MKKIKKIFSLIKKVLVNFIYLNRYYHKKIKQKSILIEAKHGEEIAGNMFYILKQISAKYQEYQVFLVVTKKSKQQIEKLLNNYQITNIKFVYYNTLSYYLVLSKVKYLFNDTTFAYSFVKKEGQTYVNTWHGTPLKMMGNDAKSEKHISGNVKRNFMFADYLIYPNLEMQAKMTNAFDLNDLTRGSALNIGYPRNAILFDQKKEEETRKQLNLAQRRVIVYLPTWRDNFKDSAAYINESLRYLDKKLSDNDVLYVKMHVLAEEELELADLTHVKAFPSELETYEVLNTADILISDYSSVIFDFANTRKKIILFTFDLAEYISTRGLYYSLADFPFAQVNNVKELMKEINNDEISNYDSFIAKFCTYDSISASADLIDAILGNKFSDKINVHKLQGNGKPNLLLYVSSLKPNGLTTSFFSLLNTIDRTQENIYFCMNQRAIEQDSGNLAKLPEDLRSFSLIKGFRFSFLEAIASVMFYQLNINISFTKKYLERFYQREAYRLFGGALFNRVIHFTGYEKSSIGLLQRIEAKRAILVHSDMSQEIKTRKNQHFLTLKSAYENYDKVVGVSPATVAAIKKISKRTDNIIILNNAHNYEEVLEKSKQEIKFDEDTQSNFSEFKLIKILASTNLKFINISRFSHEKGQKRLIDAFASFYQTNPAAYLIIIGGHGKLYEELLNYLTTLPCQNNVIMIRNMSNPFPILKKCDLFILSSFYEGLGLVLLEAQTLKIPIISTDIAGPREFLLEHGGNLVENSESGILAGMYDFLAGKIKIMNFDAKAYNIKVKEEYENLFTEDN